MVMRGAPMAAPASSPLPNMPCEIIEAIAQPLELRDRVAIISSCRALWAEPDLVNSVALFGELTFYDSHAGTAAKKTALAAWLRKRRAACHKLQLSFCALGEPNSLLASLAGSPLLTELHITPSLGDVETCSGSFLDDLEDFEESFVQLHNLTALTSLHLRDAGLGSIPQHITALSRLAALDLSGEQYLGAAGMDEEGGGLSLLSQLTSLTRLELRGPPDSSATCLTALPRQLSALRSLAVLDVSHNEALGELGPEALAPLRGLTALTRLGLAGCGLRGAPPPQLGCLQALVELDLSSNSELGVSEGEEEGRRREDAFEVLLRLNTLALVDLTECHVPEPLPYSLLDLGALGVCVRV